MAPLYSLLTACLFALNRVAAHPGHSVAEEAAERAEFMRRDLKTVHSCASDLSRRGYIENTINYRRTAASAIRSKRGLASNAPMISRRDFADYNFTHASNRSVSFGSNETLLFDDNSSCMIQSEVTQGPYYVDGELIRSDMVEDQEGVPLTLVIQLLDTSSCSPIPAVYVDLWHCNATGVYSGVSASGNGDSESDTSNLDATFLRGIAQTDVNGIMQMDTVFPGHYTGRATHIHILSHSTNDTIVRTNHTLLGSNFTAQASHVGQLFFDQSLISEVEAIAPYSTNTQDLTLNSEDDILASEADSSDPFAEYVLLGDKVSDGILAWITIGIDPTNDDAITAAATHYEDYGVANEDSGIGMPGGGMPSGMPSGSMPPLPSSSTTS